MGRRYLNGWIIFGQLFNFGLLSWMAWDGLTEWPSIKKAIPMLALDATFFVILVLGFCRGQKAQLLRRIFVRGVYYFACGLLLLAIIGLFVGSIDLVINGVAAVFIAFIFFPLCKSPYSTEKAT